MEKTKRSIAFLLAALLVSAGLFSCGNNSDKPDESSDQVSGNDTSEEIKEPEYVFTNEYSGRTINVLNNEDIYNMREVIDPKETNGDILNDTQYNAIRRLESEMGITWNERNVPLDGGGEIFSQIFSNMIMSNDSEYDLVYMSIKDLNRFASEGSLLNLLDFDELNLDKDWFIGTYNDYNIVNGSLYTAFGYSNLSIVDAIGCLIFNQSMMGDLNLELPYDAVREGSWTIDKFKTYLSAAANLNGDDSFTWTDNGKCVWGISMPKNTGVQWMRGCGEHFVDYDNGKITLTAGSESFYNAADKVASIFSGGDGSVYLGHFDGDDLPGSYVNAFEVQRALFGISEVAKAGRMRSMDYEFGVLPYPKYDENQDRYYMGVSYPASGISIPVTVEDANFSAAVGDAVNYIFARDVWDTFRTVTLESKNLRNEDSVEMLGIILNSIYPDFVSTYNVGSGFINELSAKLRAGDSAVSSVFAAHESSMKTEIEKVNEQ